MPQPFVYEIVVEDNLHPRWSEWFEGLDLQSLPGHQTRISGELPDQSALHGILMKIRDLGLTLVSVNRKETQK